MKCHIKLKTLYKKHEAKAFYKKNCCLKLDTPALFATSIFQALLIADSKEAFKKGFTMVRL